jgi:hypothetical protein
MARTIRWITAAALLGALCFTVPGGALISHNAAMAAERDAALAAETEQSKKADGLTVHFGIVPAEIVKGPPAHVLLSKDPMTMTFSPRAPMNMKSSRASSMQMVRGFPTPL